MKSDYKIRAKKFVQEIFPYLEEEKVFSSSDVSTYYRAVHCFNEDKKRRVVIGKGASRIAFITSDYVIKIDYTDSDWAGTCETELLAYRNVKGTRYEHLFAEISPFEYKGYMFYIMPRIKGIDPRRPDDFYWKVLPYEECCFLEENFLDLHGGNFGFHQEKFIIIDYAYNYFQE